VATPNYSYEKRQKELAKKRKKEDKLKRKAEGKPDEVEDGEDSTEAGGPADASLALPTTDAPPSAPTV
jgi:hypothetical protein